jgi:hypothetical protein
MIFDQQAVVSVKKILMPIDRSEYNRKIVAYAISLSKAWGAEATAIHVIHVGHGIGYGRNEATKRERIQEAKRPAEDLLNQIELLTKKEGVKIKKRMLSKKMIQLEKS